MNENKTGHIIVFFVFFDLLCIIIIEYTFSEVKTPSFTDH